MNLKKLFLLSAITLTSSAMAQNITFDTADYRAVGVYDGWEASPFRTGVLTGNAKVVDNPEKEGNPSDLVLGVQRSRFGSNLFGARIDLNETFELTTTTKYVHALIYRPVEGRVMVMALGKQQTNAEQSAETEQVWMISNNTIPANQWTDAVFPIKGAGGIDIHSLIIIPHCESPHNLTSDFAAYIDNVIVNESPTPLGGSTDYIVTYGSDVTPSRSDRKFTAFSFQSTSYADTKTVTLPADGNLYAPMLTTTLTAKPGDTVNMGISFTGTWMNSFVYLDKGNDGKFDVSTSVTGTTLTKDNDDVMSFSFLAQGTSDPNDKQGCDSNGKVITGESRNTVALPSFTIPADLAPGAYRMRVKVDWSSIAPEGHENIKSNGGRIADVILNVMGDNTTISSASRNGYMTTAGGEQINSLTVPAGEAYTIKAVPAPGFEFDYITIKYGFNTSGKAAVHGNPQYQTVTVKASEFNADDTYTIPAEYMLGEVSIEGQFAQEGNKAKITYNLVIDDKTVDSKSYTASIGDAYPAHGFEFETGSTFYSISGMPLITDKVTETKTINLTVTESLPFIKSANFESANWSTLRLNTIYIGHTEEAPTSYALTTTSLSSETENAYLWAFIGNVYEGFTIVNRAAGADKSLASADPKDDGNTGANTPAVCKTTADLAAGEVNIWFPSKGTVVNNDESGFYLAQKGRSYARLNNRDNRLAYWTGGADHGSTFFTKTIITGIDGIYAPAKPAGPIYDLNGRIVKNPSQGIYIQDGKKIVIK